MAILDQLTVLADGVSVAAAAGTINVGTTYDLGASGTIDIGNGEPMFLHIVVSASILAASAGTIAFQVVSDSTSTPSTDGTQTTHVRTATFVTNIDASNDLDIGQVAFVISLPTDGRKPYERYLGVQAVIASATVTAGAIRAIITDDQNFSWKAPKIAPYYA